MLDKKLYSIPEFKKIVPMSTPGIYKAIADGKIPSVKVARRIFIPSYYIEKLTSDPTL